MLKNIKTGESGEIYFKKFRNEKKGGGERERYLTS